jgi:hypothetical protein
MNSKQKGKRGELELAEFLREHGFAGAARGQQFKGSPGSPDVVGLPGHHIECKRVEALSIYDAYAQAVRDAGSTTVPLVAHRRNGKPHHPLPWLAILSLDDYLLLVRERDTLRRMMEPDNEQS